MGCCRPATALVEGQKAVDEHRAIGCNQRILEKLFVFGGYQPQNKECTNKLYALKFSSEACPIDESHKCTFGETLINQQTTRKINAQQRLQKIQEEENADPYDAENNENAKCS